MLCRRYISLTDPISNRQVRRIVHFGSLGKDTNNHAIFYDDGKLTHRKYLSYNFIFGYGVPEVITTHGVDSTYKGPYYTKEHPTTVSEIEGADITVPYVTSDLTMDYSISNTISAKDVSVVNDSSESIKYSHSTNTWNCHSEIIEKTESSIKLISLESDEYDLSGAISMKYVLDKCPCGTIYFDIDTGNHYMRFNNGILKWIDVTNWISSFEEVTYNKNSEIYLGRGYPNPTTSKGITDGVIINGTDTATENIRAMLANPNENSFYVDTDNWVLYVYGSNAENKTDWNMVDYPNLNAKNNRPAILSDITFRGNLEINNMFKSIDRHGNYAKKQDAVMHSLNQKLSILEGEIWNRIDKGWPLMNKSSKLIYDTYLIDTISNHPKVVSISEFQSKSENRQYSAYVRIETIYGTSEISVSK